MNEKALHKIPYGLYVISSKKGDKFNGQIANALFQVTAQPPTVAVSINRQNLTHEYIETSKVFTVSFLCQDTPMTFIGKFGFKSGRDINKFKNTQFKIGKTQAPIITDYCLGYLEAQVVDQLEVGTHTIFIGNVIDADLLTDDKVMTYEYYHQVKGGISPKTAPTYSSVIDRVAKKEERKMDKYVCTVCGYVYDPEKGDPNAGIAPGTSFEALPDDWVCPVCGAAKDAFEKE